jgi:hypothetical protein
MGFSLQCFRRVDYGDVVCSSVRAVGDGKPYIDTMAAIQVIHV